MKKLDKAKELTHNKPSTPVALQAGDMVRLRSDKPQAEATRRGVPPKWVYKWHEKGEVEGQVPGHPDQYLVRKTNSGKVVKRSIQTLTRALPNNEQLQQQDEVDPLDDEVLSSWIGWLEEPEAKDPRVPPI